MPAAASCIGTRLCSRPGDRRSVTHATGIFSYRIMSVPMPTSAANTTWSTRWRSPSSATTMQLSFADPFLVRSTIRQQHLAGQSLLRSTLQPFNSRQFRIRLQRIANCLRAGGRPRPALQPTNTCGNSFWSSRGAGLFRALTRPFYISSVVIIPACPLLSVAANSTSGLTALPMHKPSRLYTSRRCRRKSSEPRISQRLFTRPHCWCEDVQCLNG